LVPITFETRVILLEKVGQQKELPSLLYVLYTEFLITRFSFIVNNDTRRRPIIIIVLLLLYYYYIIIIIFFVLQGHKSNTSIM